MSIRPGRLISLLRGEDRLLVLTMFTSVNTDNVTGVTYGGVAMTRISAHSALTFTQYVYALVAPATGSNALVVSFNETITFHYNHIAYYTGVDQSGVPTIESHGNSTSGATSYSRSVTTTVDNSWLVGGYGNNGGTAAAGSGTSRWVPGTNTTHALYDSNGAKSPAGTYSLACTVSATPQTSFLSIMAIAPAGAAPSSAIKTWNGLSDASVKTVNGLARASVKTRNGLA